MDRRTMLVILARRTELSGSIGYAAERSYGHPVGEAQDRVLRPRSMRRSWHYVVVEGVIGVGKTTLTQRLARALNGQAVLEAFEDNPFLAGFYRDHEAHALATQLFFLMSRFKQQTQRSQPDLFQRFVIADYLFDKDRIFADINLNETEQRMYHQLYAELEPQVVVPDVVIYLRAPIDALLSRIEERARSYELGMDPEYLRTLHMAYGRFFANYTSAPVMVLDTEHIDFRQDDGVIDHLCQSIRSGRTLETGLLNKLSHPDLFTP